MRGTRDPRAVMPAFVDLAERVLEDSSPKRAKLVFKGDVLMGEPQRAIELHLNLLFA